MPGRFFFPNIAISIIENIILPINFFLFIERTCVAYEIGYRYDHDEFLLH